MSRAIGYLECLEDDNGFASGDVLRYRTVKFTPGARKVTGTAADKDSTPFTLNGTKWEVHIARTPKAWGQLLINKLPDSVTGHPKWSEYRDEAEHGDGDDYWLLFESVKALKDDWDLFLKNSGD